MNLKKKLCLPVYPIMFKLRLCLGAFTIGSKITSVPRQKEVKEIEYEVFSNCFTIQYVVKT